MAQKFQVKVKSNNQMQIRQVSMIASIKYNRGTEIARKLLINQKVRKMMTNMGLPFRQSSEEKSNRWIRSQKRLKTLISRSIFLNRHMVRWSITICNFRTCYDLLRLSKPNIVAKTNPKILLIASILCIEFEG